MKLYFSILFAAFITSALAVCQERIDAIEKFSAACREKTGVPMELVERARKGDFADDPRLKKHICCFLQSVGFMDENGGLIKQALWNRAIVASRSTEDGKKAVDKCCSGKEDDDQEEVVFECVKGLHEEIGNFSLTK